MVAPTSNAPVVSEAPRQHVLYQQFVVTEGEIPATIQRSFAALYQRIQEAGIIPAGPPFAIYNTDVSPWEMTVCAPVAAPMTPSVGFEYMELPATRVVSLTIVGPYDQLAAAYAEMQDYIRSNDLKMTGSPREIYLSPPNTPPSQTRTVIEWPVA